MKAQMESRLRAEFEAWFAKQARINQSKLKRREDGDYFFSEPRHDWHTWQAASASRSEILEALKGLLSTWDAICNAKGWDRDHLYAAEEARALLAKYHDPRHG